MPRREKNEKLDTSLEALGAPLAAPLLATSRPKAKRRKRVRKPVERALPPIILGDYDPVIYRESNGRSRLAEMMANHEIIRRRDWRDWWQVNIGDKEVLKVIPGLPGSGPNKRRLTKDY